MKKSLFSAYFICLCQFSYSQGDKISLEINYGLNGNFFVRNYEERSLIPGATAFYKKKFIGTITGIGLKYNLSSRSKMGLEFARSENNRIVNYEGGNITIIDYTIRHINNFYQLYYEWNLNKKSPAFASQLGIFYLRSMQQEIEVSPILALIEERNFKNSRLEEGGVFAGLHFSKKIDTKFDLGIKSRVYYLVSTQSFEAITLTPTLTYHF